MASERMLKRFWTVCLLLVGIGLITLTFTKQFSLKEQFSDSFLLFIIIGSMAFFAEYVDSSLGMGYGTTLTPVLIIMGFSPLNIVPAVLFSECISGLSAGFLHHKLGNVDLKRGTQSNKIMTIMALCSVVGSIAAVILALNLPKAYIKLYIGLMILGIGAFLLLGNRLAGKFSWGKIIGLGSVAAFNKGISGGGYGPLLTGGQVLIGVPEKNAVGITSFAEGITCLVGLGLYIFLQGGLAWALAAPLSIGAILSVPAATWTVKVLPSRILRQSIGYATLFLGALTLIKIAL